MKNNAARYLFLALLLVFSSFSTASACINQVGQSRVSEGIYVGELSPEEFLRALQTRPGRNYWEGVFNELKAVARPGGPIEERNNLAVAMLHLGKIEEGIEILKGIEKRTPGLYYTATNLGTAYELHGENAKALEWIKEGIKRNKDAHSGSEWLHVKILEAKLALGKDPDWLANNSVIGLHGITNEQLLLTGNVTTGNLEQPIDLKQVEAALVYQLHERLEFIKPPEGVVANLLFDLSRTLARTTGPEHAATIRNFAQTYGPDLMPWSVLDPELPAVTLPPPFIWDSPFLVPGTAALLLMVLAGVTWVFMRRRS